MLVRLYISKFVIGMHDIRLCFRVLIFLIASVIAYPVFAECSRTVQVPVSVTGLSVIVKGNRYTGITPDFLSLLEAKSNCRFAYYQVPKNRQEFLFESGKADLLITTVKTDKRDKVGHFVPLIQIRATLISMQSSGSPILSFSDLLSREQLRLVAVRGFDYGIGYQEILKEMAKRKRLIIEPDAVSVARSMQKNSNYVTIMTPTLFSGFVRTEKMLYDLEGKVRYDKLDELPWTDSGIYISKSALPSNDQIYLKAQMDKLAATDVVWKSYLNVYPSDVVKLGLRRLPGI